MIFENRPMIIETGMCREQREEFGTEKVQHRNGIKEIRTAGVPMCLFQKEQQKAHQDTVGTGQEI